MNNIGAEIIHLARQGNEEAFAQIVDAYQTPVFNLCYRMLGNAQEAEDAAQESFWRAYQNMKSYDPSRSFITWLLSIAAHYCIDRQRKRQLPTFEIDAEPEFGIPDHSVDPERSFDKSEKLDVIQKQLGKMEKQDRMILIMKYWYELSEKEIAESLNLTISAVKSRLFRARKELARLWEPEYANIVFAGG